LDHQVRIQTAVTASKGQQRGDVQIKDYHNGAPRDLVFDLSITHERWGAPQDDPSKAGQLRHPADINKPLREAAKEKTNKYQHTFATIIVSLSCPPSSAPPAASSPSSFACSSTTLIGRARSSSALQVS